MAGRPPAYETPEQMQEVIEAYFAMCDEGKPYKRVVKGAVVELTEPIPYTMSGLALALGFTSRQTLLNYEGKPAFVDVIKRARTKVLEGCELALMRGDRNPTGPLFLAKNAGRDSLVDKTEHQSTIDNTITVKVEGYSLPGNMVNVISGQSQPSLVAESVADAEYEEVD